ncbi:MAG: hypothetical protein MZW92_01570 [Comamonadaceae bacterium]|nr:hypothetical protein [Comamonadaceae bacterium]
MLGFDEGLALHMGKILECAAIAATPGSGADCALGDPPRGFLHPRSAQPGPEVHPRIDGRPHALREDRSLPPARPRRRAGPDRVHVHRPARRPGRGAGQPSRPDAEVLRQARRRPAGGLPDGLDRRHARPDHDRSDRRHPGSGHRPGPRHPQGRKDRRPDPIPRLRQGRRHGRPGARDEDPEPRARDRHRGRGARRRKRPIRSAASPARPSSTTAIPAGSPRPATWPFLSRPPMSEWGRSSSSPFTT